MCTISLQIRKVLFSVQRTSGNLVMSPSASWEVNAINYQWCVSFVFTLVQSKPVHAGGELGFWELPHGY